MTFSTYLQEKQKRIKTTLQDFIAKEQRDTQLPWQQDVSTRLGDCIPNGKLIRGTLVYLGLEATNSKVDEQVDTLALAMEYVQTGLLIHDDIIDHADTRRGTPSIYKQYISLSEKNNFRYPKHTGTSLGICTGDAAFFYGYKLLSEIHHPNISTIYKIISDELMHVTFAQMQDIEMGASSVTANLTTILTMYAQKTGYYSISLPLLCGALLGNADTTLTDKLYEFGKYIGIAFQLQDDRLDIFGDPQKTGKPIGGDFKEGKQTPYIYFLRELKNPNITECIDEVFQKGVYTEAQLATLQHAITTYGIDQKIQAHIDEHIQKSTDILLTLSIPEKTRELYTSFVSYLTNRVQ